jgi:hypothetical protein
METESKNIKSSNNTYNPELDYLMDKVFFKEKMERARAFIKEHGLPEEFMKKSDS